jgi:hypothetical protein
MPDDLVDLVPGQDLVRGDVEVLTDRLPVAHQADQAHSEILGMGQGPQARAVPRDDDLVPPDHPIPGRPVAGQGWVRVVVGVGRPDDGDREALLLVGLHEDVLGRDLRPRIAEVGVVPGRRLDEGDLADGLVVDRCRADVHVLLDPSGEQVHGGGRVLGTEAEEVDDAVECLVGQRPAHRLRVLHVRRQSRHPLRQRTPVGRAAPVEDVDLETLAYRLRHTGRADRAGSADVEDLHAGLRFREGTARPPPSEIRERGRSGSGLAGVPVLDAVLDEADEQVLGSDAPRSRRSGRTWSRCAGR